MNVGNHFLPSAAFALAFCLPLLTGCATGQPGQVPVKPPLNHDLLQTCSNRYVEATRLLLARGASPNVRGKGSLTPLIVAASNGQPELIRLLLAKRADVKARSHMPHETTALAAALYHREWDVVRINAVPPDPGGESMRGEPLGDDEVVKDTAYAEVIRMLQEAIKKKGGR